MVSPVTISVTLVCTMFLGTLTVGWCMMTAATHPSKIGLYLTGTATVSTNPTSTTSTITPSTLRMGFSRSGIMHSVAIWSFVIHDSQDFSESLQKVWNNYSSRSNLIFCKQVPKGIVGCIPLLNHQIAGFDGLFWIFKIYIFCYFYFEIAAHRHIQFKYLAHRTQWSCDFITKYKWL